MEDKFYTILGAYGASTIAELIGLNDKKAIQNVFTELGNARHEE